LILKSHLSSSRNRKSIAGQVAQCLFLQEQQDSLRAKLLLAIHNPIMTALDPNYILSTERKCMLRNDAVTTLAYRKALQESLLLAQFKSNTNTDSSPLATQSLYTSPLMINMQHDIAPDKDEDKNGKSCPDTTANIRNQRDPTHSFPSRLHEILSNPEYSECITWLPHGRSWKILRPTQFERLVIPRHFRHGKYSSFMRQVRVFIDQCFIHPCLSSIAGNTSIVNSSFDLCSKHSVIKILEITHFYHCIRSMDGHFNE
jgi:HSF-type DNA-binding